MRRGLLIAIVWVAAVVVGTVVGVASIGTLGGGDRGGPLSRQEVEDRLARGPQPTTGGTGPALPSPAASPTASPVRRYFTASGGSLWATCAGGLATLDTLTPRSGYRLDGSDRGPAAAAWVRFRRDVEHGHGSEYVATVTCPANTPKLAETGDD